MRGATGKPLARLVNLGIGGSDLGPRMAVEALKNSGGAGFPAAFVANIDPLELARALDGASAGTTLFSVVSKTFTTQETLANAHAAKQWLAERLPAGGRLGKICCQQRVVAGSCWT